MSRKRYFLDKVSVLASSSKMPLSFGHDKGKFWLNVNGRKVSPDLSPDDFDIYLDGFQGYMRANVLYTLNDLDPT